MRYHPWITAALRIGAGLLVVLAVCGALWGLLTALGDDAGADAVRGVALVALACGLVDFVLLVVVLALAELSSSEGPPEDEG